MRMTTEKHVLTVPGRYEQVKKICDFVVDGAESAGLPATAVFHVELACDEACTNIIEHAYGGENKGKIEVSWSVEGKAFVIVIHDNGRSFDPEAVPAPNIPKGGADEAADQLRVGGLGIHFMRKIMDDVQFHFDENGNTLTLVKKIS